MLQLVDAELNAGHWLEGYEVAAEPASVGEVEGRQLLEAALSGQPEARIDIDGLKRAIWRYLPQVNSARPRWLVLDDCSFLITDTLCVARFRGEALLWCTPRLSLDGIQILSARDGRVYGLAWVGGSSSVEPDTAFELDVASGEVLVGQVLD